MDSSGCFIILLHSAHGQSANGKCGMPTGSVRSGRKAAAATKTLQEVLFEAKTLASKVLLSAPRTLHWAGKTDWLLYSTWEPQWDM